MKIWIHVNGVQEGPFDETNLPLNRMDPTTPVWYEGLKYWMPASKAPITAQLLTNFMMQGAKPQDTPYREESQPIQDMPSSSLPQTQDTSAAEPQYRPDRRSTEYSQSPQQQYGQHYDIKRNYDAPQQQPPTYMIWSILLTVLCCNPIGIIPIITGSQVTSKFRDFNYEGARKSSETTEWWLMITIVTSLMLLPFTMLIAI